MTSSTAGLELTTPNDREIVLTRFFQAPRALVFDVCTRAEHIRHWWGCDAATIEICEVDLRVGGAYRIEMRLENGMSCPFKGVYREICRPERVVFTQIYDVPPINEHEALVTITLTEHSAGTLLVEQIVHDCRESRDGHLNSGVASGAAESFDRMAALLDALQ